MRCIRAMRTTGQSELLRPSLRAIPFLWFSLVVSFGDEKG